MIDDDVRHDHLTEAEARVMYDRLARMASTVRGSERTTVPERLLSISERFSRRWLVVPLVGAAAAAGFALISTTHPSGKTPGLTATARVKPPLGVSAIYGLPVPDVGTNPFGPRGREITLANASTSAGFRVPVPHVSLANSTNVSNVWFASSPTDAGTTEREVVLDYVGSGVRITIQRAGAGFGSDPTAAFKQEASDLGLPASSVQTVDGAPALVVAPANGKNGFVDMDLNGIRVAVIGARSIDDLTTIANSIN